LISRKNPHFWTDTMLDNRIVKKNYTECSKKQQSNN
jgi:hypothetical protein